MGWYQDNFPGSPAARQRTLLSRGLIVYSLVAGTAIFFFAPFCRRLRRELLEEGRELEDWDWFKTRKEMKNPANSNWFYTQPSLDEFMRSQQYKDKEARNDVAGPDIPEEAIRSFRGSRA